MDVGGVRESEAGGNFCWHVENARGARCIPHPLFVWLRCVGGMNLLLLKPIIHKAFKWTKIEIYYYLRYLLSRFDFAKRHFSNLQLKPPLLLRLWWWQVVGNAVVLAFAWRHN